LLCLSGTREKYHGESEAAQGFSHDLNCLADHPEAADSDRPTRGERR